MVDAYLGLGPGSLLIRGSMGAVAFLLIYAAVLYFLNNHIEISSSFAVPYTISIRQRGIVNQIIPL